MRLVNEFAAVDVKVDLGANGVRLKVVDLNWGDRAVYLDPVHLEALVWADPTVLDGLIEPERMMARLDADGPRDRR